MKKKTFVNKRLTRHDVTSSASIVACGWYKIDWSYNPNINKCLSWFKSAHLFTCLNNGERRKNKSRRWVERDRQREQGWDNGSESSLIVSRQSFKSTWKQLLLLSLVLKTFILICLICCLLSVLWLHHFKPILIISFLKWTFFCFRQQYSWNSLNISITLCFFFPFFLFYSWLSFQVFCLLSSSFSFSFISLYDNHSYFLSILLFFLWSFYI